MYNHGLKIVQGENCGDNKENLVIYNIYEGNVNINRYLCDSNSSSNFYRK